MLRSGIWNRDQPFEVYKLEASVYRLQTGEPFWTAEADIGIGRYQAEVGGLTREILAWYDQRGNRHLSAEEKAQVQTEQERQARSRLEAFIRSQGFDPDNLPKA